MDGTDSMRIRISIAGWLISDLRVTDTERYYYCEHDGLLAGLAKVESKKEPMVNSWVFSCVRLEMAMAALEELCTFENINQIAVDLENVFFNYQPTPEEAALLSQFIEGLAGIKNLDAISLSRFPFFGPMINVLTKLQSLRVFALDILYSQFDALAEIALKDALIMMPKLQEFGAESCTLFYCTPRGSDMSTRQLFMHKIQDPVEGRIATITRGNGTYDVVFSPHHDDEWRVCNNQCSKIYVFNIIPNPTPRPLTRSQHRRQQTEDNLSVALSKITNANAQTALNMLLRGSPFLGGQLPDLSRFCSLRSLSIINCGLLFD